MVVLKYAFHAHHPSRFVALLAALIGVFALVLSPGQALADERAEQLFTEGKDLLEKGDFAAACPKLEESYKLSRGVAAQYFLARCIAKLGKTATAYQHFKEVAEISSRVGQMDRADTARQRMSELEPRLMKIRFVVNADAPGLEVSCDGKAVAQANWGRAVPFDPGSHTITASAPGHEPWEESVTLSKAGKVVDVTIPSFGQGGDVLPVPFPDPEGPDEVGDGPSVLVISGIVIGGLGIAGLAVSGGLAGAASSTYSDSDAFCDATGCDQAGLDLVDDARGLGNAATAVFVVGGVLLAGGVTMIVVSLVSDDDNTEDEGVEDVGSLNLELGPTHAAVEWTF